jgi:hypothetical protein
MFRLSGQGRASASRGRRDSGECGRAGRGQRRALVPKGPPAKTRVTTFQPAQTLQKIAFRMDSRLLGAQSSMGSRTVDPKLNFPHRLPDFGARLPAKLLFTGRRPFHHWAVFGLRGRETPGPSKWRALLDLHIAQKSQFTNRLILTFRTRPKPSIVASMDEPP